MLKCIVERFKKYRLKGRAIRDERKISFYNMETARRCTLFWVAEDIPLSSVDRIHQVLAKYMEVHLVAFMRQPKTVLERKDNTLYVDCSSVSSHGEFMDSKLKEMLYREDDLFIDLSVKQDVLGDYMMKSAHACCKLGMERKEVEHDIELGDVKDVDGLIDRLIELLTKINTY